MIGRVPAPYVPLQKSNAAPAADDSRLSRPQTAPSSALEDELTKKGITGDKQQEYIRRLPEVEAIKKLGVTDHAKISEQLGTAMEGTFTSRQRVPGEKFYARSHKGGFNGNWTSPVPTNREEAVQGHALAWGGTNFDEKGPDGKFKQHDRGSQHSEAKAYKYVGGKKDSPHRWIAESIAGPQIHGQTGEHLPGGLPQQWQEKHFAPSLKRDTANTGAVTRDAAGAPEQINDANHDAMPMAAHVKLLGVLGRARQRIRAKKATPS